MRHQCVKKLICSNIDEQSLPLSSHKKNFRNLVFYSVARSLCCCEQCTVQCGVCFISLVWSAWIVSHCCVNRYLSFVNENVRDLNRIVCARLSNRIKMKRNRLRWSSTMKVSVFLVSTLILGSSHVDKSISIRTLGLWIQHERKKEHMWNEMFAHFRVCCFDIEGEHKESEQNHSI